MTLGSHFLRRYLVVIPAFACLALVVGCGSSTKTASPKSGTPILGTTAAETPAPAGSATATTAAPSFTGAQVPNSCSAIASVVGSYIGGVANTTSLGSPQHLSCEFANAAASTIAVVNIGVGGTAASFAVLRTSSTQGGRTVESINGLGASAFAVSKNGVPAGVSVLTDQGLVYAVEGNLPISQDEAMIKQLMKLP